MFLEMRQLFVSYDLQSYLDLDCFLLALILLGHSFILRNVQIQETLVV